MYLDLAIKTKLPWGPLFGGPEGGLSAELHNLLEANQYYVMV